MINDINNNNLEEKGNWLQHFITKYIILNPPPFEKSDYESLYKFKEKLIFIEREEGNQSVENYIPCLFYRNPTSSNYLIYFHGNSEHIFKIEHYGLDFRSYLDMNVLLVEYPGYSIYPCEDPESNIFFSNTYIIYNWIKNKFKINDDQIFICGRSLGTSSAIYLSSIVKPRALFLISAFTSLKNIGKDKWVSPFLEEIFNSYRYIKNITCPILFIHGEKDLLININHSEQLSIELQKSHKNVKIEKRPNMTHNDFDFKEDIINSIKEFIRKNNLLTKGNIVNFSENELKNLYKTPSSVSKMIELKLFDISNFTLNKKIDIKNAIFSMKSIEGNLIFTSGRKIIILNQKNYDIEDEIEINTNEQNAVIKCLIQLKNKNIVCGTNLGDIFIYGNNSELNNEDMLDEYFEYKEIKHIKQNSELYKLGLFLPDKICVLSKNDLKFYDENLNEEISFQLRQLYTNFVQISENQIAMLSYDHLAIFQIRDKKLEEVLRYLDIESNIFKNILTVTNKYIVIAGKKLLYFFGYKGNKAIKNVFDLKYEINYISKIHDEFILAATNEGKIIRIIFKNNNTISRDGKKFIDSRVNSLFLKNLKTLLITDDISIQIWHYSNKKNGENCNIF